jgi:signal transduction histidine kinase
VRLGGSRIGVLLPGRPAPPALLAEVAEAAALLVEVVRLRLEVAGALREVEASRARLLHAGYAERRRLERDLHDGAQQRLVSLGMALRLAQRHLHDGALDLGELLDGAVAELATSVAELRQLAHGLRPSSLDDGLGPALDHLTSTLCGDPRLATGVRVEVEVDPRLAGRELPDDVSTTAYFVASEAMTNAVKHAAAGRIGLCVTTRPDGAVLLRVSDDGRGGAVCAPGSGLAGLQDRVAALGGSLSVRSPAGRGTVLEAVLPCAS